MEWQVKIRRVLVCRFSEVPHMEYTRESTGNYIIPRRKGRTLRCDDGIEGTDTRVDLTFR